MAPDNGGGTIPGLTRQGEMVLRLVVREEVQKGVKLALADPICPRPCERVKNLEEATYGDGRPGVLSRVVTIEEQVSSLVWQTRLIAAATVTAIVGLLIALVTGS